LKKIALGMGRAPDKEWRSLKLIEECLVAKGVAEDEVRLAVDALRKVRDLRTTVKSHAAPRKRADAVKNALTIYGTFRAHFEALTADCDDALSMVISTLDIGID